MARNTNGALGKPYLQDQPQRRIPGTDAIALTSYRAADGSYREYQIFTEDGVEIGRVTSHSARLGLAAGYHEGHRSYSHNLRTWSTLTEAADDFLDEHTARQAKASEVTVADIIADPSRRPFVLVNAKQATLPGRLRLLGSRLVVVATTADGWNVEAEISLPLAERLAAGETDRVLV